MKNTIIFALAFAAWGGVNVQAELKDTEEITSSEYTCFLRSYNPNLSKESVDKFLKEVKGKTWGEVKTTQQKKQQDQGQPRYSDLYLPAINKYMKKVGVSRSAGCLVDKVKISTVKSKEGFQFL